MTIRIGALGDFNPEYPSHVTIGTSLQHAGRALGVEVEPQWLATPSLVDAEDERLMARFDGLWAAPASPYQSILEAASSADERPVAPPRELNAVEHAFHALVGTRRRRPQPVESSHQPLALGAHQRGRR